MKVLTSASSEKNVLISDNLAEQQGNTYPNSTVKAKV